MSFQALCLCTANYFEAAPTGKEPSKRNALPVFDKVDLWGHLDGVLPSDKKIVYRLRTQVKYVLGDFQKVETCVHKCPKLNQ